ncbi:MAG: hypothetical protein FJ077_06075 [Cyanobacteria bacterium K_DeepCast_35m_m2_023]|nr:hypothetical protein [Cyanobacteria bacterium K_DeepCast_35m_m2_023]
MRTVLAALALMLTATSSGPVLAQSMDNTSVWAQQQNLQQLLNGALSAIRNDDPATACQLRRQALAILNANLDPFMATYPTNNWADLQISLQGSVNKCTAQGF